MSSHKSDMCIPFNDCTSHSHALPSFWMFVFLSFPNGHLAWSTGNCVMDYLRYHQYKCTKELFFSQCEEFFLEGPLLHDKMDEAFHHPPVNWMMTLFSMSYNEPT